MVEADESELPRIAENKRTVLLTKDEVIVFAGSKFAASTRNLPLIPR